MMHKNPSDRIKIAQIKEHPWFSLYKVSFQEPPPDVRQSNLITDSMIMEGEDPFEDFMNKRLKNSQSSGGKSPDDSKGSFNDRDSDFGNLSAIDEQQQPHSYSFKKQERFSDLTKDNATDPMLCLEIIPEEKGVTSIHQSGEFTDLNSAGKNNMNVKRVSGDDPFEERDGRGRGNLEGVIQLMNLEEREQLTAEISNLK